MSLPNSKVGKFQVTTLAYIVRIITFYIKPSSNFNNTTSQELVKDKVYIKVFREETKQKKYLKDLFKEVRQLTLKYKATQKKAQVSRLQELIEAKEQRKVISF